jgi:hypothetical protein
VARLRQLLGKGRLEVLEFRGLPVARSMDAGMRDATESLNEVADSASSLADPARWRAPRPGTPILVVSDFSIGARPDNEHWAPVQRWRAFADDARASGFDVLGLIPYESSRWPTSLAPVVVCVPWSERTTAGIVRRIVRRHWARRS